MATNAPELSERVLDLSQQNLRKLLVKLPDLRLEEVTFPVRGRGVLTLSPGSWRRIPVKIKKMVPYSFDQLHFLVTDGGGKVSTAHDTTFDPANPHIVLLAGAKAGTYKVVVLAPVLNNNPRVVGHLEFVVDGRQTSTTGDGPSIWIDGAVASLVSGHADWGEGGNTGKTGQTYPEVKPALGTKQVLTLVVDTASDRFPAAEATAILTDLRAALTDGALDTIQDNVKRSVRAWYEEVSYYIQGANPPVGLTIDTRIEGPISLAGSWDDYFPGDYSQTTIPDPADPEPDPKKKKQLVVRRFYGTENHYQPIVDAVVARNKTLAPDQQVDFRDYDVLFCVIRSVRPTGPTDAFKSYWPRRQFVTVKIPTPTVGDPAATQDKNLDPFNMPDDWPSFGGRTFMDTISHEFGHSIGLGDLYAPAAFDVGENNPESGPFRNMQHWDTMAWEDFNPHFSLVTRLKLGWAQAEWLKRFNFKIKNDVDEIFTISAVEKGAPPAGSFAGAEVRIGSNWNYYIEYRARQTGQIGDNALPTDGRVICTDAIAQGFQVSSWRPEVMLLWNDKTIQSDGPVLGPGQSYLEQDPNGNGKQIKISVLSITSGLAKVRVQYKVFGVDLGIRPWPAGPDRPWQSPDIEVRNEKSKNDPSYLNTAWTGQPNDVVAKITNSGTADAPKVAVQISIKNFNLGGDTPVVQPLAKILKDVPAGATVEFVTQWIPPIDGHFCIHVEILPYATPGPPMLVDMNPVNSVAQSNYSTSNLGAASPTERTITTVKVGNPHNKATTVYLIPSQTNPFYRTYLSNRWLRLKPKEVREVTVMSESRLDWHEASQQFIPFVSAGEFRDLAKKYEFIKLFPQNFIRAANEVSISAYMPDPTSEHMHVIRLLGGAQVQARSGRRVEVKHFEASTTSVVGRVTTVGVPTAVVKQGQVIIIYSNPSNTKRAYLTLPVVDGSFANFPSSGGIQDSFQQAQAYYVPNGVYGGAYSELVPISQGGKP